MATFTSKDLVFTFKESAGSSAEAYYEIEYVCATKSVFHYVDATDYQSIDGAGLRTYRDVLTHEENRSAGLTRDIVVKVTTRDADDDYGPTFEIGASNPQPTLPSTPVVRATLNGAVLRIAAPTDTDVAGYLIHKGTTSGFTPSTGNLYHDGPDTSVDIEITDDTTYYLKVAPYDSFGKDSPNYSTAIAVSRATVIGEEGPPGADAKLIVVTSTHQTLAFTTAGAVATPATIITFTTTRQNTSAAIFWRVYKADGVTLCAGFGGDPMDSSLGPGGGPFTNYFNLTVAGSMFGGMQEAANLMAANSTTGLVVEAFLTDGTTLSDRISLVKVRDGAVGGTGATGPAGASAKIVTLTASHQTFKYDTSGAIQSQTTTFKAAKQNIAAQTHWGLFDLAGTFLTGGTAADMETTTASQFTRVDDDTLQMTQAGFNASLGPSYGGFALQAWADDGTGLHEDKVSVVRVQDGQGGLAAVLTNEAHQLPADKDGNVLSYTGAGGSFKVYLGTADVSSSCSFLLTAYAGLDDLTITSGGVYTLIHATADVGYADITATHTPSGQTVTRRFSFTKSKTGATGAAGQSALAGYLTNEAHTVPADVSGNVLSYTGAGGQFKVLLGTTDVTAGCHFTSAGVSNLAFSNLDAAGNYAIYNMTADTGYADITATHNASGQSITKRFSVSKSKTGTTGSAGSAGADAKLIYVTSTHQTFAYTSAGAVKSQTTTITVTRQNLSGTVQWNIYTAAGGALWLGRDKAYFDSVLTAYFTAGAGAATLQQTHTQFNQLMVDLGGAQSGYIAEAYDSTDGTILDRISIVKVQDGANGANGTNGTNGQNAVALSLSSAALAMPAISDGTVKAVNLPKVVTATLRSGSTDVSASASWSVAVSGCTASVSSSGVVTIDTIATAGYVDVSAVYSGQVYTARIAISIVRDPAAPASATYAEQAIPYTGANTSTSVPSVATYSGLTLKSNVSGALNLAAVLNYYAEIPSLSGVRTFTAVGQLAYRAVGTSTWSFYGSPVTGSTSTGTASSGTVTTGVINLSAPLTGLAASTLYEVGVAQWKSTGTSTSPTIEGSFSVTAP